MSALLALLCLLCFSHLGEGAFGEVYKGSVAVGDEPSIPVAIKVGVVKSFACLVNDSYTCLTVNLQTND